MLVVLLTNAGRFHSGEKSRSAQGSSCEFFSEREKIVKNVNASNLFNLLIP